MSFVCCTRSWSKIPCGGHLRCQTSLQYLSARELQRIGRKVGRSYTISTMAPATSALKREIENWADDSSKTAEKAIEFAGVHHVGMLCESVERSLKFYCGVLGLEINPTRPNEKLSFGGVWLNVGSTQMIHLMELPNPDPTEGRPQQGGQDRHACIAVKDVTKVKEVLVKAGVPYTFSPSGSSAVFARDPDGNTLEFSEFLD